MLRAYAVALRELTRNVRLYLLATGLIGLAFDGGVFSVLFNLYLLRMDFGPEFIGQVNSAGLLIFALASLPSGAIGARMGARPALITGLLMMMGGGGLVLFVHLLPSTWQGPAIMGMWSIMYAGMAIYFVNAVPFVMEISIPKERAHAFPLQTALMALTGFTGSLIGGVLPRLFAGWLGTDVHDPLPYRLPLIMASLVLVPAIVLLLRIPLGKHDTEDTLAPLPTDSIPIPAAPVPVRWESSVAMTLVLLAIVRFFQVTGVATTGTFFNVYMDTALAVPTSQIGMIAAVGRLGGVFAALSTPLLVQRWGAARTLMFALTVSALSLLPLALIPHWLPASLGFLGVTALSSMRYPAFMLFAIDQIPPKLRGTLAGSGEFAGGVAFAGIALVGGYMIAADGFTALFLLGGGLTLIGGLLFYLWFMLPRAKPVATPAPRPTP